MGIFDLGGQLGKGLAELGDVHHGVEPETVAAARLAGDLAHHATHGDQGLGVLRAAHGDQGADHGGTAVVLALHLLQQGTHVGVVAFFVAKLRGVVGGVHPGQTTKGIHAQACVVGQRRQAGVRAGKARLGQGVFNKGTVRLFGLAHAQVGLAHQLDAQGHQHGLQLGKFAAVVGCENQFHSQNGL